METISYEVNSSDGGRPIRDDASEYIARRHAGMLVPPQLTAFESGRIAAPFDRRPLGDCLFPMPSCTDGYMTVLVRSKALEEELSEW